MHPPPLPPPAHPSAAGHVPSLGFIPIPFGSQHLEFQTLRDQLEKFPEEAVSDGESPSPSAERAFCNRNVTADFHVEDDKTVWI